MARQRGRQHPGPRRLHCAVPDPDVEQHRRHAVFAATTGRQCVTSSLAPIAWTVLAAHAQSEPAPAVNRTWNAQAIGISPAAVNRDKTRIRQPLWKKFPASIVAAALRRETAPAKIDRFTVRAPHLRDLARGRYQLSVLSSGFARSAVSFRCARAFQIGQNPVPNLPRVDMPSALSLDVDANGSFGMVFRPVRNTSETGIFTAYLKLRTIHTLPEPCNERISNSTLRNIMSSWLTIPGCSAEDRDLVFSKRRALRHLFVPAPYRHCAPSCRRPHVDLKI
jgi:hypothetical protein